MRRRLTLVLAALFAAVPASSAQAGYFLGQPADAGDIVSLGGVTLARAGQGDVGYLKRDGGTVHVFTVPLVAGNPAAPPRRLDTGQIGDSSDLRISSANNGRAAAVWLNGGSLFASVRPRGGDWGPPQTIYSPPLLGPAATAPSMQMGPSGAAYVAFEVAGDVRVAWLRGTNFELLPDALDIERSATARGIDLATAADGSAIAAWSESGNVYTRRIVRTRLSSVPREASVDSIAGLPAGNADSPSVDMEDDSTYVWIAVRQDTPGGSRIISRRLIGSEYEDPIVIDNGVSGAETPDLDLSGRGRGVAGMGVGGSNAVLAGTINRENEWQSLAPLTTSGPRRPLPAGAVSEDGRSTVAWHTLNAAGQGSVMARYFNARLFEPPVAIERPEFGPVDADAGLDATADLFGNHAIAWVQGQGADRRVLVSVFDKEPRGIGARQNLNDWTRKRNFKINWRRLEDPWGPVRYRVEVDGDTVATTERGQHTLRNVRDGAHVLNVISIDSRGQEEIGPDRALYVDTRAPTGRIVSKTSRRGRAAEAYLHARDGNEILDGAGIDSGFIRWGDGSASRLRVPTVGVIDGGRLGHVYRRRGRFTIRVEMRDQAGNRRVVSGRVSVR